MTNRRHASTQTPVGTGTAEPSARSKEPERLVVVDPSLPSGRFARAAKAVGFHVGALVLFSVPAVILWWHVWSGHPANTLTCACGDPAQEVWFLGWPAWAITHLHNPFFSGVVNVPAGANLLSNTSGTLVGVVLAPVTWLFGPVAATNVALTLAPAFSAWGCFAAIRPLVTWKWGAVPAALVFGYSAAIYSSLIFGHVSVTLLVFPPLLFTTLHEIFIRQEHSVRRDGLVLAALIIGQFLVSPEVLVLCAIFAAVGVLAVVVVGWRQLRWRSGHALPALGLGLGVSAVLLAYPTWFGLAGPQAVTGVLFIIAPLAGVPLSGLVSPGPYGATGNLYVRFGGYLGREGPSPDYLGGGLVAATVASVVLGRRRALTWLMLLLGVVALWLSLGQRSMGGPSWFHHVWLPWSELAKLPLLKEILPDQIAPFLTLFIAFLLALGLDALYTQHRRATSWLAGHRAAVTATATAVVAVAALVPVFATFDVPLTVRPVTVPSYIRTVARTLPEGTVLLTVPFAVSGSAQPMLWQAVDHMQFDLAGAALKTPGPTGGPVEQGAPGSARRVLTNLSVVGEPEPSGTPAQLAVVLHALRTWGVDRVVVAGTSRNPLYATGFFTMALGVAPTAEAGAEVWTLQRGVAPATPAVGALLPLCWLGADRAPRRAARRRSSSASSRGPAAPERRRRLAAVRPILHLSLPVRDLEEAEDYYVRVLGCQVARRRTDFIDVWFFGLQLTLHDRPDEVTGLVPGGSRHFGVTLGPDDFGALVARVEERGAEWLVPVTTDDAGLQTEQTKAKVVDPSGNVIEVKTYPDVVAALELPNHLVS